MNSDETALRSKIATLFSALTQPEFAFYKDLLQQGIALIGEKSDDREALLQRIERLQRLLEQGKVRNRKIQEIDEFYKSCSQIIEHSLIFPEFQEEKKRIQKELALTLIQKKEFQKLSFEECEARLSAQFAKMQALKSAFPVLEASWKMKIGALQARIKEALFTLHRKLFELFTLVTPYPDAQVDLLQLRKLLFSRLQTALDSMQAGKINIEAFCNQTLDLVYDVDVIQLRREFSFRGTRLRELRLESHRLLCDVQKLAGYLELSQLQKEFIFKKLASFSSALISFIRRLENPWVLFEKAFLEFEDVNIVIRKLWIELEAFQQDGIQLLQQAKERLLKESFHQTLEPLFLQALDDLEEVLKKEGKRPQIMLPFQQEIRGSGSSVWNLFFKLIEQVETKYLFTLPFILFMKAASSSVRQMLFLEAALLDASIESTKHFAKSLQYIKVFDEERVDVILEAFEWFRSCESPSQFASYKAALLRAARLVEEELLLDIGSVDRRALLDVNEAKLHKTLAQALLKAGAREEQGADIEKLMNALQDHARELFTKKIAEAAAFENREALYLLLCNQVLENPRVPFFEAIKLLVVPAEREALLSIIENLGLGSEERQAVEELLGRMQRAPKRASIEHPLNYVPGCLNFFR